MNWRIPENDEQWTECLSAYMDGEIPDEERSELEEHLRTDDERARQLDELRVTSDSLKEWEVSVPEPTPEFVRKMNSLLEKRDRASRPNPGRLLSIRRLQPVVFSLGIFCGIIGTLAYERRNDEPVIPETRVETPRIQRKSESVPAMSADTDAMLREVAAAGLRNQVIEQIEKEDWEEASSVYDELVERYGDTSTVRDFQEERNIRFLRARFNVAGRR